MSRRGRPPYPDVLTPREQEALALLREGLSNEEIAQRMGVSLAGAKYHVSEILSKLGVASREEAARWEPERPPWWLGAVAPLGLLLRQARTSWLGPVAAAGAGVAVAAAIGVLVWGLVRTGGAEPEVTVLATGSPGGMDWSPDGGSVAYALDNNLYRADAPDFSPHLLVQAGGELLSVADPRWSPDGSRIAFLGSHPGRGDVPDARSGSIWIVNADGTALRDLLPGNAAQLSPSTFKVLHGWLDEETIEFDEHCGTACQQPYLLDVATGSVEQAVRFTDTTTGSLGVGILGTIYYWSPDGRWIAAEDVASVSTLLLHDSREQRLTRLAPQGGAGPWQHFDAWAPGSAGFLYEEAAVDGFAPKPPVQLRYWDVELGESREVAPSGRAASWSEDGERIAYITEATAERPCGSSGAETACIAVMDLASGTELYRVPGPGTFGLPPIFLPDGRLVYGGYKTRDLRLAEDGESRVLANVNGLSEFHVSPNGQYVIASEPGLPSRILLVPIPPP